MAIDASTLDPARLRRIVAQHARTSQLLGVDFVPLGAAPTVALVESGATAAPMVEMKSTPAVAAHAPEVKVVSRAPAPAPVVVAAKPNAMPPAARPVIAEPLLMGTGLDASALPLMPRLSRDDAAARLDALRARYEADAPHAHFVTDHTNIVFGEGDPHARLMFIGEAPGQEEDRTGRPFVGRAGQLLDKMILGMGLKREQVYIANVLKTRPPNNATPTLEEAALCAPYLYAQVAIIRPEAIVCLGLPATRCVLGTSESMSRLRGRWGAFAYPARAAMPVEVGPIGETDTPTERFAVPVMPTYHPAFLLRSYTTENRQKVWSDLQMVMERLGIQPPKRGGPDQQQLA